MLELCNRFKNETSVHELDKMIELMQKIKSMIL